MRRRRFDVYAVFCALLTFLCAAVICAALYINASNRLDEGELAGKRQTPTRLKTVERDGKAAPIMMPVVYEFIVVNGEKTDRWIVTVDEYDRHEIGDTVTR